MNSINREVFLSRLSKDEINAILALIEQNPFNADILFELLTDTDKQVVFNASWVLLHVSKSKTLKNLFIPHFDNLLGVIQKTTNVSLLRNGLRYFIEVGIPKHLEESMVDFSFEILSNKYQEVAILNSAFLIIERSLPAQPELIQPLYESVFSIKERQPVSFHSKFKKFVSKYSDSIRTYE